MKYLLLSLVILLTSCNSLDQRFYAAKEYAITHLPEKGLNASVLNFEKVDGTEYKNKYDGTDMYALEFIATCKLNDVEGYMLMDKDSLIRNLHVFDYNIWEQASEFMKSSSNYVGAIAVNKGKVIRVSSKVIMKKGDNGWNPIALRWDLY